MLEEMLHVITQLLLPSQTDLLLDRVVADDQTQTFILEVTSTGPSCYRGATQERRQFPC